MDTPSTEIDAFKGFLQENVTILSKLDMSVEQACRVYKNDPKSFTASLIEMCIPLGISFEQLLFVLLSLHDYKRLHTCRFLQRRFTGSSIELQLAVFLYQKDPNWHTAWAALFKNSLQNQSLFEAYNSLLRVCPNLDDSDALAISDEYAKPPKNLSELRKISLIILQNITSEISWVKSSGRVKFESLSVWSYMVRVLDKTWPRSFLEFCISRADSTHLRISLILIFEYFSFNFDEIEAVCSSRMEIQGLRIFMNKEAGNRGDENAKREYLLSPYDLGDHLQLVEKTNSQLFNDHKELLKLSVLTDQFVALALVDDEQTRNNWPILAEIVLNPEIQLITKDSILELLVQKIPSNTPKEWIGILEEFHLTFPFQEIGDVLLRHFILDTSKHDSSGEVEKAVAFAACSNLEADEAETLARIFIDRNKLSVAYDYLTNTFGYTSGAMRQFLIALSDNLFRSNFVGAVELSEYVEKFASSLSAPSILNSLLKEAENIVGSTYARNILILKLAEKNRSVLHTVSDRNIFGVNIDLSVVQVQEFWSDIENLHLITHCREFISEEICNSLFQMISEYDLPLQEMDQLESAILTISKVRLDSQLVSSLRYLCNLGSEASALRLVELDLESNVGQWESITNCLIESENTRNRALGFYLRAVQIEEKNSPEYLRNLINAAHAEHSEAIQSLISSDIDRPYWIAKLNELSGQETIGPRNSEYSRQKSLSRKGILEAVVADSVNVYSAKKRPTETNSKIENWICRQALISICESKTELPLTWSSVSCQFHKDDLDEWQSKRHIPAPSVNYAEELLRTHEFDDRPGELDALLSTNKDPLRIHSWQVEAYESWNKHGRRGIVEAVTGSGKTLLGVFAAIESAQENYIVVIVVPRIILQEQWLHQIRKFNKNIRISLIGGDHGTRLPRPGEITIAVADTFAKYQYLHPQVGANALLIADEVHNYSGSTMSKILAKGFSRRLGLTATLIPKQGGNLNIFFDYFGGDSVFRYGFDRALPEKVVVPYLLVLLKVALDDSLNFIYQQYAGEAKKITASLFHKGLLSENCIPTLREIFKLKTYNEFALEELNRLESSLSAMSEILAKSEEKPKALRIISEFLKTKQRSVIFTDKTHTGIQVKNILDEMEVRAKYLSSQSKPEERRIVFNWLESGRIDSIIAPRILDEGVDFDFRVGVFAGVSRQQLRLVQRLGRLLRKADGKNSAIAVILVAKNSDEDPALPNNAELQNSPLHFIVKNAQGVHSFDVAREENKIKEFLKTI